MKRKLIVIGNGFDLHLNIKSKFSDFFEKSEKQIVEKWIDSQKDDYLEELNFFSLLLYNTYYRKNGFSLDTHFRNVELNYNRWFLNEFSNNGKLVDWMDVEEFIKGFITSKSITKLENLFYSCFNKEFNPKLVFFHISDRISLFFNRCKDVKKYKKITFYEFLIKELTQFENRFKAYMLSELTALDKYDVLSFKLLSDIIGNETTGIIIDFNYTILNYNGYEIFNVHGNLNNEIIIGIDAKNCDNKNIIPFTKTFRKITRDDNSKVLSGEFDEIIIYGHSLGEQDYSYFQTIFDYVDLYGKKTVVRFIYSDDFFKTDDEKYNCKIEKCISFYKLIEEYGKSIDNQEKGKNLLHKMILEGRLKIEQNNF